MKINKRGVIGSFTTTFVATLMIFLILIYLVFIAVGIKEFTGAKGEVVIQKEDSLGIDEGVGYMENYIKLVEAKSIVDDETSLGEAILEVGYEK